MKLKLLVAALGLVVSSAHAAIIMIDDFNTPGVQVCDLSTAAGVASSTTATGAGNIATSRTITHELLEPATIINCANSAASMGTSAIPTGALTMANGSTVDSVVTVEWAIAPFSASDPASLYFRIILSDDGQPPSDNTVQFLIDGASIGTFGIANGENFDIFFPLTAAQLANLTDGGTLKAVFNGTNAWDLSLDMIGLSIPEPTSLALLGLALVGLGAARRRKV